MTISTYPEPLLDNAIQLLTALQIVEDPRLDRKKLHPLQNILLITLLAIAGGARSWGQIVYYGTLHQQWFARYLDLTYGIPSHDTFSRVFGLLSPETVEQLLQAWAATRPTVARTDRQIVFDGKRLRGASQWQEEENPVHVVNAYCPEEGITLAQTSVKNKQNEISALPYLIEQLNLKGAICTGDAMFTQKDIAKRLLNAGANYCLALKDNQQTLKASVESLFGGHFPSTLFYETTEKNRGRIETRKIWVSHRIDRIKGHEDWQGLNSLIRIESRRGEEKEFEVRYYISSLKLIPEEALKIVRRHWGIENGLHRTLDVYLHEDQWQNRLRNAAANLAVLRKVAGTILQKLDPKQPIVYKMMALNASDEFRDRFISFAF